MKITIHTDGVTLGKRDEQYLQKKIANLSKYGERISDESVTARIDVRSNMKSTVGSVSLHVTLHMPRCVIRAEVDARDVSSAVDLIMEKLKKQLDRYQHKMHDMMEKKVLSVARSHAGLDKIAKRKLFSHVIPMSEEEAIEQIELIDHDFYIFVNEKTRQYNVLYKRAKGGYGLIALETREAVV